MLFYELWFCYYLDIYAKVSKVPLKCISKISNVQF